jgi:uncharacterized protein
MTIDRRTFLRRSAALTGGLALGGPLQAFVARSAAGRPLVTPGYGSLVNAGPLFLPPGFSVDVISVSGELMSDGNPTPTRFDGMEAFPGTGNTTVLIRNHENRKRRGVSPAGEIDVIVPTELRYDPTLYNGGVTKLVVQDGQMVDSYAVLGGTTHNCAGGSTPWGSWITCEELYESNATGVPHGYVFEVSSRTTAPVEAVPIVEAGRFEHEAVAWLGGMLYETEDRADASFYRYIPTSTGDLAAGGSLQALKVTAYPTLDTRLGTSWPGGIGASHAVEWVPIANPNPPTDTVRAQARAGGAAIFARTEGIWTGRGKIFFDCTTGGGTAVSGNGLGLGQVFEYDPETSLLTLIYQQTSKVNPALVRPDNMAFLHTTGDLFLCEDVSGMGLPPPTPPDPEIPNHVRGLTPDGMIFDFCRAKDNNTEFCGACFDSRGKTMYLNQQGNPPAGIPGVTYAITGPWHR